MKILALALASAAVATMAVAADAPKVVEGKLQNNAGEQIGTLKVTEAPKGVMLHLEVQGLTPGWHGLHFHEKGDCSKSDFTSAGTHVHTQPSIVHGLLNPDANDSGDLPNLYVGADGKGMVEIFSPFVSVGGAGGRPALLDADGSAVIIHASPDDYMTQPIGGAGARVACAAISGG
ncbi:MAG: superoxide dismutase[Cu-Zn] [Phenylobacterium sp.]|uniref:superoxide dismutase[Cu-Zn] n=1 Tax=Phenylobacterium sp. TaxID=1871053 RepID=UPI003918D017